MMLLLLISLFSNYHCNEVGQAYLKKTQLSAQMHRSIGKINTLLKDFQQEIQKQKSLLRTVDVEDILKDVRPLNYSTPAWREGTARFDQTGRINPVFPQWMTKSTPKDKTTKYNLWENLSLLPKIQLSSTAGSLDDVPEERPDQPDYSLEAALYTFPTLPPPPSFAPRSSMPMPYLLDFYTKVNRSVYAFSISTYKTVPREGVNGEYMPGSPSIWTELSRPTLLPKDTDTRTNVAAATRAWPVVSTLSPSPLLSLPGLREPFIYNPKWSTNFNFFTVSKRMNVRINYTQNKRITKANRITSITHRPRQIERTLSKAQAWVRNKQWMKTSQAGRTSAGTTSAGRTSAGRTSAGRTSAGRTSAGSTKEVLRATGADLLKEDHEGFLYVSFPASITTRVIGPTTYAGNVLYNAHRFTATYILVNPNQKYYDLMKEWDEGYMITFLLQLTQIISREKEKEVKEVFHDFYFVLKEFTPKIAFAGETILTVLRQISIFCSDITRESIDHGLSYAGILYQLIKERDTALSVEMNSVIDYADLFYDDEEGEDLFTAIREFEEYPNTTESRNSHQIGLHLLTAFTRPYRRLKSSQRWGRLQYSLNKIIKQRFDIRRANDELLILGDTELDSNTAAPTPRKSRRLYRRQQGEAEYRMLRTTIKRQRRFSINTPKQRFKRTKNMIRPKETKKHTKPTEPPNAVLQYYEHDDTEDEKFIKFIEGTDESDRNTDLKDKTSLYHRLKESLKQVESKKRAKRLKVKADLIRKIVEGSSYSDEEASLTKNLMQALLYGNRTFEHDVARNNRDTMKRITR